MFWQATPLDHDHERAACLLHVDSHVGMQVCHWAPRSNRGYNACFCNWCMWNDTMLLQLCLNKSSFVNDSHHICVHCFLAWYAVHFRTEISGAMYEQPSKAIQPWSMVSGLQQHCTWSAFITTNRARSASCWATCLASTALVNCSHQNKRGLTLPGPDILPVRYTSPDDNSCL